MRPPLAMQAKVGATSSVAATTFCVKLNIDRRPHFRAWSGQRYEEGFFFFEKKKQKTFAHECLAARASAAGSQQIKVFLLLFLQKKKSLC